MAHPGTLVHAGRETGIVMSLHGGMYQVLVNGRLLWKEPRALTLA